MKTYWGEGIDPGILDLSTRRRRVADFSPRPLYPRGKSPRYQFDGRVCGPQSWSGRGGEETYSQPPPVMMVTCHYSFKSVRILNEVVMPVCRKHLDNCMETPSKTTNMYVRTYRNPIGLLRTSRMRRRGTVLQDGANFTYYRSLTPKGYVFWLGVGVGVGEL
jgi:hypothetical protein